MYLVVLNKMPPNIERVKNFVDLLALVMSNDVFEVYEAHAEEYGSEYTGDVIMRNVYPGEKESCPNLD